MSADLPRRSVLSSHLGPESVLLDTDGKRYFRLNDTGQAIWRCIEAGMAREDIVAELTRKFDVDDAGARAEVERFIAELTAAGLLVDRDGT